MDEVLPEAGLRDFTMEVAYNRQLPLISQYCFIVVGVLTVLFQAAHVAVKQYIGSRFSHLLLDISGLYC